MEIRRHCHERLPGGERLWRKAARIAGFDGTIEVYGFGVKRFNKREMFSRNRGKYGITLGYFNRNKITVFVKSSPCAVTDPKKKKVDPLMTLCHELGHYRQQVEGTLGEAPELDTTLADWRANAAERGADAYGRWLLSQIREK